MPVHCSYCHKANHVRVDCHIRKTMYCWTCLATGHLRAHCPKRVKKTPDVSQEVPKKSNKPTKKKTHSTVSCQAPKRSPPSSDSEPENPSPTRPPTLKQSQVENPINLVFKRSSIYKHDPGCFCSCPTIEWLI